MKEFRLVAFLYQTSVAFLHFYNLLSSLRKTNEFIEIMQIRTIPTHPFHPDDIGGGVAVKSDGECDGLPPQHRDALRTPDDARGGVGGGGDPLGVGGGRPTVPLLNQDRALFFDYRTAEPGEETWLMVDKLTGKSFFLIYFLTKL